MQSLFINDLSRGWTPQADPVNGDKRGLLKFDSLELDQNGAVTMVGGTKKIGAVFTTTAHTIYSRFLASGNFRYLADTAGKVFRNNGTTNTEIGTAGSTTRAAFGAAYDYVLFCSGSVRKRDDGSATSNLGVGKPLAANTVASSGAAGTGNLLGTYTWCQINIIKNVAYVAKSPKNTTSAELTLSNQNATITPRDPIVTSDETRATEIWIFRRGGLLNKWYRIKQITNSADFGIAFIDSLSDEDAIALNITLDEFMLTVNSTDLTEDILEIVGPIFNRWLYFTKSTIHFSDINNPDGYHPNVSIGLTGGLTGSEVFLWAKLVGDNTVLIGTTKNIYILVGTFILLPDGYLDVYLRPLGVKTPPISIDADVYNGSVVFMSAHGWTLCSSNGQLQYLCPPNLDKLYRGNTVSGYGGVPIYIWPAQDATPVKVRYSCCVVRNKLWCRVPVIVSNNPALAFTYRMEIYDFARGYWQTRDLSPLMLFGSEDGIVIGFFDNDKFLKEIDYQFAKTLDNASSTKQTIKLHTLFNDAGLPRSIKDSASLKLKINTGGDTCTVNIYKDDDLTTIILATSATRSTLGEITIDLNANVGEAKNWAIELTGQLADFVLSDLSIVYEPHPELTTAFIIPKFDFGAELNARKKRIRTWPFVFDSRGGTITLTPILDGTSSTTSSFTNTQGQRTTKNHFFKTDIFNINYGWKLTSPGTPFEVWEVGRPDIVQILPIAKQFDQFGPIETFRYGKLRDLEVRLIAFGGTTIPYIIYNEDVSINTGNLIVTDGKEEMETINLSKDDVGSIFRVELGPTSFDFHVLYARLKVNKSGSDTESQWVELRANQLT